MQALNAAPREHLDPAVVDALLHADDTRVAASGADLLGLDDEVLADLTPDLLAGGRVSWDGDVDIHRECQVRLSRELVWDRDRVRLWVRLRSDLLACEADFYVGVFILQRPTQVEDGTYLVDPATGAPALDPATGRARRVHECTGLDKLYLLRRSEVGDTWTAEQGVSIGDEAVRLLTAAEYRGLVVIAPELFDVFLPEPRTWPVDEAASWLQVLNQLLADGGADQAVTDEAGTLHLRMLVKVEDRPVDYVADADDQVRTIVGPRRAREQDLAKVPNVWTFVASAWDLTPVEGDGLYGPVENLADGPTSITARGQRVRRTITVDAATQDALVAQAEQRIAADKRAAAVRTITLGPLPVLGHADVIEARDAALTEPVRCVVTHWELDLAGEPGPVVAEEVA